MFSKRITLFLSFVLLPILVLAQVNKSILDEKELDVHILMQDSLLFHLFFEKMDSTGVEPLIHEDFEFYHDLSGFMDSKKQFLNTVSAFQQMEQKISREIIPSATECFYLYDSDLLYAVIHLYVFIYIFIFYHSFYNVFVVVVRRHRRPSVVVHL